jgi:hypothetical protein
LHAGEPLESDFCSCFWRDLHRRIANRTRTVGMDFAVEAPLLRPLRVPAGRRFQYSSQIQTPLIVMSRLDYDYLPNPYNTGVITQYFYDPHTGDGAYTNAVSFMNVWPSPVDYTSGFRFTAQRPLQDLANLSNLPDLPVEWTAAIKWNLAQEIMGELGTPTDQQQLINTMAPMWFQRIQSWDREPEGVRFGVAFEPGYRVGI